MDDTKHDEILTIRCQLGEPAAWGEFVTHWHPRLWRFVSRMHGNPDISDDLLQTIWLKVVRSLVHLKDPSKVNAWMYRVARNVVMDRLRTQYRQPLHESIQDVANSDNDLEAIELSDQLNAGLLHLHPTEREVAVLFYLEERPLSDISAACGIPIGTAKSRLHRARKNLQRIVNNE